MNKKVSFKIKFINYVLNKVVSMFWMLTITCGLIFFYIKNIEENMYVLLLGLCILPIGILHSILYSYKAFAFDKKEIKKIKSSAISREYYYIDKTRKYAIEKSIDNKYLQEFSEITTENEINEKINKITENNSEIVMETDNFGKSISIFMKEMIISIIISAKIIEPLLSLERKNITRILICAILIVLLEILRRKLKTLSFFKTIEKLKEIARDKNSSFTNEGNDYDYIHEWTHSIGRMKSTIKIKETENTYLVSMQLNEFEFVTSCIDSLVSSKGIVDSKISFIKNISDEQKCKIEKLYSVFIPIAKENNVEIGKFSLKEIWLSNPNVIKKEFLENENIKDLNDIKNERVIYLNKNNISNKTISISFTEDSLGTLYEIMKHFHIRDNHLAIKLSYIFNLNVKKCRSELLSEINIACGKEFPLKACMFFICLIFLGIMAIIGIAATFKWIFSM